MKLVGLLLSLLSFAPFISSANSLNNDDCNEGFTSTLVQIEQSDGCHDYRITVNYDGSGTHELSNLTVEVPCGDISSVSNSEGFQIETDLQDPNSKLYGFKIDEISGFGGDKGPGNFTIDFSVCTDNAGCSCALDSYDVQLAYKAATCVSYESVATQSTSCEPTELAFRTCDDIAVGDKLYKAESFIDDTHSHSLWFKGLTTFGTTAFEFTKGQLFYNADGAQLIGELRAIYGGGSMNNSIWILEANFLPTDIIDPKKLYGEPEDGIVESWIYYLLDSENTYMYEKDDPKNIITLSHQGNPFQIGLGANHKTTNDFGASAWFNWEYKSKSGIGDININLADECPPTLSIEPIIECVDYNQSTDTYTAKFGYNNKNDETVIIPVSASNKFSPEPLNRNQPYEFFPGQHLGVFEVEFDGQDLTWSITSPNGTTSSAMATNSPDQRCEGNPCDASSISGGSIVFNGTYNPNEENLIENVELASGPFDFLGYEYIWMKSEVNEPNVMGNDNWSVVEGSENLTELAVSGLDRTMYYVRCARVKGCEVYWGESNIVELALPDAPTALISGTQEVCPNEPGIVLIELTGTAPFTGVYTDGQTNFDFVTDQNAFSFEANEGTYALVSISDAYSSGIVEGSATITYYDLPTVSFSTEETEICEGTTTPVVAEFTGSAPWDITYSNGNEEITIAGITESQYTFDAAAGDYSIVSVSDVNCSNHEINQTLSILKIDAESITITSEAQVCDGELSTITITKQGTEVGVVSYLANGVTNAFEIQDQLILEVGVGTYVFESLVVGNCIYQINETTVIEEIENPEVVINTGGTALCEGEQTTISLTSTKGASFYVQYTKDGIQQDEFEVNGTNEIIVGAGSYSFLNARIGQCEFPLNETITITSNTAPEVELSVANNQTQICPGETAELKINFLGEAPFNATYTDGSNTYTITSDQASYTVQVGAGSYEILAASDANCAANVDGNGTVVIETISDLSGSILLNDDYCLGGVIALQSTINNPSFSYFWSTTGNGDLFNANSVSAVYRPAEGDEEVEFFLTIETPCSTVEMTSSTSVINLNPDFTITPVANLFQIIAGLPYEFSAFVQDANNTYTWEFGDGTIKNGPEITHTFTEIGQTSVTLTVERSNCSILKSQVFEVQGNQNLFIPNVINPLSTNEDNSHVRVYGENISESNFTFEIYNRWGLLVYETNNLSTAQQAGWNGNVNGENAENNVFTYIVRGQFNGGDSFEETGTITLVK